MALHSSKLRKPNERLTYYRKLQHLTQTQLADELYNMCEDTELDNHGVIDKNMISKWERGEHIPDPFWQKKLCKLFKKDAVKLGFITPPILQEWDEIPYNNQRVGMIMQNSKEST